MTYLRPIRISSFTGRSYPTSPTSRRPFLKFQYGMYCNSTYPQVTLLRTKNNDDGSETNYYSNGTHEVLKVHESGDRYSTRYTDNDRKLSESYVENGVQTENSYDDFERLYSNTVFQLDDSGRPKSYVDTRYEYYGESKLVQKTDVFDSETGKRTVTQFAEDGKTPIEYYIQKGAVTTYYDPKNHNKVLKEVTDKGTVQEVRVPDENGNLVLQEGTE